MYAPNGPWLLCRLVANSPDCFKEGKITYFPNYSYTFAKHQNIIILTLNIWTLLKVKILYSGL